MTASVVVPGRTRWTVFDAQAECFYVNIAAPAQINDARSRDYDELVEPLNALTKDTKTRKNSPEFVFANTPSDTAEAIPYDMFEVEFSHHGDCCTFETFIERFGIRDRAVHRLAELIHDADLEQVSSPGGIRG